MADFITAIRTTDGDKKYDYNSLGNLPDLDAIIAALVDVGDTARLANDKADEALAGAEVANGKVSELTAQMGDIDTALDSILEIQNALIGGDGE